LLRDPAFDVPLAEPTPTFGLYRASTQKRNYTAWICFYRAWVQAGDLQIVDSLFGALEKKGFEVRCLYSFSLRSSAQHLLSVSEVSSPDVILAMQSFSISAGETEVSIFEQIGCPVIQVPAAFCSETVWGVSGLGPAEVAMNVALPELDGRVFSTVTGFREEISRLSDVQFSLRRLVPAPKQVAFIAEQARRWARLRKLENSGKRVAIILSNYPNRDGRIGNGVGLDTPASAIKLLERLRADGYKVDPLPATGEELMCWLQAGPTNDAERSYGKAPFQTFCAERLRFEIEHLPPVRKQELLESWDLPSSIPIAGVQLSNIFVGIQPQRGFSLQPQEIYHSPTLPPPPEYLAFYLWIRQEFGADAIIHFGKHGNLEWLPGRATALSEDDYPQICLGPLPHLYPFIVNNPGEGTQAKRRTSAVIIDHLTPPLVRSGLYTDLEKVERLLEEHAQAAALYPSRTKELERQIDECVSSASWRSELVDTSLQTIGNYLCEIKESQIRSGLHILGTKPTDEVGFLLGLVRISSGERQSIITALTGRNHVEDLTITERDAFEVKARAWLKDVLQSGYRENENSELQKIRTFVRQQLVPRLTSCSDEIENILSALRGEFVPPGPAGAPTRGRFDVLPTGRNFFSIDPRSVPTQTAWHCGKALADSLIERHRQEQGEFPRRLALVIWG
ncbi:MAG: cobaltochelatase subunit CobN, partial [Verrucomicrobia bacterium]|nr:cobaltochelatase subunit CobN [Verrucomicrobiota bacterium]